MVERRKPRGLRMIALCKMLGHRWRRCLNPKVRECERCGGRWESEER